MDKLVTYKVGVDANNILGFVHDINSIAPYWFLHGAVLLGAETGSKNVAKFHFAIYGEGEFIGDDELKSLHCTLINEELTEAEYQRVEGAAVIRAINICLGEANKDLIGDVLLNKHPECRDSISPGIAIIKAALVERQDTFTKEDYEEY